MNTADTDLLRRAAALMRERAQAATPGPQHRADAEHIAALHPIIALYAADWLDDTAAANDHVGRLCGENVTNQKAVAFARAYLGEEAVDG